MFQKVLRKAKRKSWGTIFLIQGPPGAGKTALLHECGQLAQQQGWGVAHVEPSAWHDRSELVSELGKSYAVKKTTRIGIHGEAGGSDSISALLRGMWGWTLEFRGRDTKSILKKVAKRRGLVLVTDEVQDLRKSGSLSAEADHAITHNLRIIHNARIGAPVVLLVGGLGTSETVLRAFGISRLGDGCLHQLGRLSDSEGKAVIEDWLVEAGGASKNNEHLPCWIDTLAARSFGWPQNVQSYAQVAARWLLDIGSVPTPQVPPDVLTRGEKARKGYYQQRTKGFREQDRIALANLLRNVQGKMRHFLRSS